MMDTGTARTLLLFLSILVHASCQKPQPSDSCRDEAIDCEAVWGRGSVCLENSGVCSNPYHGGCLATLLPDAPIRVCNSEDGPHAVCREEHDDDMEVRIYAGNWESSVMEAWLLQIVLSELLGVPTTIESGSPTGKLNLYEPWNALEFGTPEDKWAMKTGFELGDCRLANRDAENYEPCAHISPESWEVASAIPWVQELVYNGTLEQPGTLGVLGEEAWFVTKFTAVEDPSLTSYLGLQNQRQKLADLFLRPTTWKDYCDEISPSRCRVPDTVTQRAPSTPDEDDRMFVEGLYTGYFRKTEENNCTLHPDTCTGHIGDYPCGWTSHVESQTHHLNIPLQSSGAENNGRGYKPQQLADMWRAANATRSNLMMFWWRPEPLYQEFIESEAAFQRVLLPPPTQSCVKARLTPTDRCADEFEKRVGSRLAACDESPKQLEKLMSTGLYRVTYDDAIPDAMRNPAYDVLNAFRLSELQLGELFEYRRTKRSPREAVCVWASENMDHLKTFLPRTYPRKLEESEHKVLTMISLVFASVAVACALVTGIAVYKKRHTKPIEIAQVEFLWLLLAGLMLVALGAITNCVQVSNVSCLMSGWLVTIGYTLELIPLIVKVAAINRLDAAARKFRRVVLKRRNLFLTVGCICLAVIVYMTLWTLLDPPVEQPEFELTNRLTEHGETIVLVRHHCDSMVSGWKFGALGWHVLMLVAATVLAFQTQRVHKLFNECHTLAVIIYTHLLFVILRSICCFLSGYVDGSVLKLFLSLVFSASTIVTLAVYFYPKLFFEKQQESEQMRFSWRAEYSQTSHRASAVVTCAPETVMNPHLVPALSPVAESVDNVESTNDNNNDVSSFEADDNNTEENEDTTDTTGTSSCSPQRDQDTTKLWI